MNTYSSIRHHLKHTPKTWLITGVAGFIGSHLLEALLKLDQKVIGLDNFSTGYHHNLRQVEALVSQNQWQNFKLIEGDIRSLADCQQACIGADYILHQAALGSVSRSIEDPLTSHATNISGFLNMLVAARDVGINRFIYAASSSTYGDHPDLPKIEDKIGQPLSPYAVTKYANELYANVFYKTYGLNSIGLRYFNVFGPRQDVSGAYAAVIPKWITAFLCKEPIYINGDGHTSRDFCYIDNAVQANILAAMVDTSKAVNQVYNIAVGQQISLNELFNLIQAELTENGVIASALVPIYRDFRKGDIKHSLADISKAKTYLGYHPSHTTAQGLKIAMTWYTTHA